MQALSFPFSAHPKMVVLSVEPMASKSLFGTARSSPEPPKAGAQSARLELAGPNKQTVPPVSILCQAAVHSVSRCRVHGSLRSPIGSTAAFMRQKVGAAMSRARSAFLQPQEEWRGRRRSSRQGPLTAIADSGSPRCLYLLGDRGAGTPLEWRPVTPHVMQNDRQFPRNCDHCPFATQSFDQCASPFLEWRGSRAAAQHDASSLVKQGSHSWVASTRDSSSPVGFTRLESPRSKPEICSDGSRALEPVWIFDRAYVRKRNNYADARGSHETLGDRIGRCPSAKRAVEDCDLLLQGTESNQHWFDNGNSTGLSWIADRAIWMYLR